MDGPVPEIETRRRWMSRPRSLAAGFLLSVGAHAALVLLFVVIWNLLPLPPIRPIKVFALPDAPTRAQIGLTPDGRLPEAAILDSSGSLR